MFRSAPYSRNCEQYTDKHVNSCFTHSKVLSQNTDGYRTSGRAHPGSVGDPITETYISRTLYLCKLPYDVTEDVVRELCEPFGDLKKVVVYPHKGIAFVEYFDIRKAEGARNTLKSSLVQGRVIDAQYSRGRDGRPSRDTNTGTLYIRPIINDKITSDPNTVDDYRELFCTYGEVKKVSSNRKRESEKFVEFYDIRGAEASQKALNGYEFNGVVLEIQFANTHSRTLNSDSRIALQSRHSHSANQSFRPYEGKCRRQSVLGPNRRNRSSKNNSSEGFTGHISRDSSYHQRELAPNFSLPHSAHNGMQLSSEYNMMQPFAEKNHQNQYLHSAVFPQLDSNNNDISKIHELSNSKSYPVTDSTKTGNLAESLKTLLSTLKQPANNNESDKVLSISASSQK